tara:strand:- start:7863 stop:8942 length:1080 start_codon:yes stop_codon:yes gene_type:complete
MYFLYFCLIIIIYYVFCKSKILKDNFTNYKKVTVTPKSIIYNKLYLNIYSNNSYPNYIASLIKNIYPIHNIYNKKGSLNCLYNTNRYPNAISIIQEPSYYFFKEKYPDNNIRFVSSIGLEKFTLITPLNTNIFSWKNINNNKIGTLTKSSASYISLNLIKTYFKKDFSIKSYSEFSSEAFNDLKEKKIDAFFIITSHPNLKIINLTKEISLRIFGIDGLDKDILKLAFPKLEVSRIDLENYNIFKAPPNTLSCKVDIICNSKLPNIDGYNLIQTIFKNFIDFKTKGSSNHKLRMRDFNPEYIYLSHDEYTLHSGVYKFYKEIGLITDNPSLHCRYKVGIGKCDIDTLNNFRLLSHTRLL